jgi:replicative DNA helicase
LIVDYLQRIVPDDRRAKRWESVGEIARGLKSLARELSVPVLVLSQLNREADRKDGEPRLSHLRESGDIEADADVVLLLDRPELRDKSDIELRDVAMLRVAKNRNGCTGTIRLRWLAHLARFERTENQDAEPADFEEKPTPRRRRDARLAAAGTEPIPF